MTPTPELYVAHPVLDGGVATETTVYVARCPHEGCHHAPDHGDPQVALDAVMGHWHREHVAEAAAHPAPSVGVRETDDGVLLCLRRDTGPEHSPDYCCDRSFMTMGRQHDVQCPSTREAWRCTAHSKRPLVGRAITDAEASEGVEFAKPIGGGPKYAVRTLDPDELRFRRLAT